MRAAKKVAILFATLSAGIILYGPKEAKAQTAQPPISGGNIGLPETPGGIGKLKRGEDGKIFRSGPSDRQQAIPFEALNKPSTPNKFSPPEQPGRSLPRHQIYNTRILENFQGRSEHESRANRQQIRINAILRDEARAKSNGAPKDARGLTVREIALLEQLQRHDRKVKVHEMEHFQTGQSYASFPQYFYVTGPINRKFAI